MLVPANRLLAGLGSEFKQLSALFSNLGGEGSSLQAIAHGLDLLSVRESGGVVAMRAQFASLATVVGEIDAAIPANAGTFGIPELMARIGKGNRSSDLAELEAAWRGLIADFEKLMLNINTLELDVATRARLIEAAAAWETMDFAAQSSAPSGSDALTEESEIESKTFERYLQQRFDEPGLRVTAFAPLPGGFGKQTLMFTVAGKALDGDFVLRRDQGADTSLENDCHYVAREYPVVKAVHERGFPSAEVLWLETNHDIVPGGDFMIMRRAPGAVAGSAFGPSLPVPDDLADSLATIAAKLHGLEPLVQLGDVASFIRTDLWALSRGEVVRRYIRDWYDLYLRDVHIPSPTLVTLYGWLFENIPDRAGVPSLIHGDIGFHNFLFDQGRLSAVLDWEFAHIGDPAEELGYIATTVGSALDWSRFMSRYVEAGGDPVDPVTLHFFKVWSQVRNATAANLHATGFSTGALSDLNLVFLIYRYIPLFLNSARQLILQGPDHA
jgi:aminoglycoside phosphotransferase (APT) family kinase protein